uniref:Cap-specific mRNA (nucleoside-2'-O-)-methyltransferase 2 n=1 Tax=Timema poppense TaxID=170557 RepID=A0A7R9D0A4_TIMPO|nr:unnamed protein product [Timema poppensis]
MNRRGAQDTCGDLKQFQGKESPQSQCNGIAYNSKEHSWRRPPLSRSKCSTPSSMGASSWQHSTPITHAYHHSNSTEDGVPWRSGSRNTTFSHSSSYDGGKLGSSQQSFLEADLSPIASHTSSCGAQENTNVDILGCGYNGSPLTHSSPYNTPGPQDAKPKSSKSPSCHSSYNSTSSLYRSDGLPKSFSSRSSSSWVCPADVEQAVLEHFGKKYEFKPPAEGWTLPDAGLLFKDDLWTSNIFQKLKRELNEVKSQLNDFSLDEWHRHTRFMNKAGDIIRRLRDEVDPEFPTQAWCKFYENVSSTSLVPKIAIDNSVLNTIHLCEAPGAFITSLNHFLTLRHPNIIWKWLATTLNPYYEGNPLSIMINDDRFILQTLEHWTFGEDNTGDLMNVNNMKHLLRAAADMGPVALVTADGSIDCQDDPGEQESVVAALHYCEAVTALHALAPGGSFLLKMFTMYEQPTICLMYLLCCAFTTVVVNKPATSKEGNSEVYVCCMGYHGSYTLQPWLKVLTKHFSPEPSSKAMFPKKSIPRHFVEQLHACASIFKKYQSDVIQNNIDTYRDRHMNRSYVKQLRRAIADEFFNRYQMRKINPKHEIIGKRTVQHSPYLNKDSKTEDVSFNERLKKKEVEPLIKLYHLEEELAQLEISWPFEEDVNWLCFSNCVTGFKLTLGKPVKTVNSSKFCQGNILNIRNRVKAAAQEFNLLKTPVTESNKPLIPQWVKNKFPKQSWAEFKIINYKEQLWDSMEGSKNEDYEKNAFIDIMELKSSMLVWLCLLTYVATTDGMLYPKESETREVVSLDGIWKFKWDKNHEGFSDIWFSKELQNWTSMPVPSSFNDIPVSSSLRDHVGWVWYQRSFYAPTTWLKHNLRVFIRLGSVHYAANVWLKGELVTSHRGGALPFQGEVTQSVNYGGENIVTVAANNTLSQHTIPQGTVLHTNNTNRYPLDYTKYSIVPDYFNYAGIHRPVVLYTVPQTFIDDIIVHTDINDTTGVVHYTVSYNVGEYGVVDPACHVELLDHQGVMVSNGTGLVGTLYIPEANFWWPRLTHSRPGYLYTLKVTHCLISLVPSTLCNVLSFHTLLS